ncbi:protein of unknown function [Xenorhabdus doucetiae]|uniref:Uncharacterized protein n=1 Tax=Xenorhabdus doucetiae TaxID=351671 RepID=A0A068QMG8_9GAMM|nr:protein of unknown function [Xenorhabdus doucetiae]
MILIMQIRQTAQNNAVVLNILPPPDRGSNSCLGCPSDVDRKEETQRKSFYLSNNYIKSLVKIQCPLGIIVGRIILYYG